MNIIQNFPVSNYVEYGKYICEMSTIVLYHKHRTHVSNTNNAGTLVNMCQHMILKEKGYIAILCLYKNNNKHVKTRKQIQVYTI